MKLSNWSCFRYLWFLINWRGLINFFLGNWWVVVIEFIVILLMMAKRNITIFFHIIIFYHYLFNRSALRTIVIYINIRSASWIISWMNRMNWCWLSDRSWFLSWVRLENNWVSLRKLRRFPDFIFCLNLIIWRMIICLASHAGRSLI